MTEFIFKPSLEQINQANVTRLMKRLKCETATDLIKKSQNNINLFWKEALEDLGVIWQKPYTTIRRGDLPWADWFIEGRLNIVENCLDKHQDEKILEKIALIWEGDCGATKKITYRELQDQVAQFADGLSQLGICSGDAVGLYLPMIPEMVISFFAILKLGAVVVPIFSGFGPEPTSIRLSDAEAKILITADGSFRRGKKVEIKKQADLAVSDVPTIQKVIVAKRTFEDISWNSKDLWFDDVLKTGSKNFKTVSLPAEATSLVIYTSGTTGKPKGTVHTHAGALAQIAKEVTYVMDCKSTDTFFWMTDIGWMMGPWEIIGTLFNGASLVIFEGTPDYPNPDRLWEVVEKHQVTILGVSPTAIRLLRKHDQTWVTRHNLSHVRLFGSTGEAWDPDSYQWLFEVVGQKRCPIMNISGGTEIIGCHLAPLPIIPLKSCTLGLPGLGMDVDVFNEEGKSVREEVGYLVCKQPAPSMTKGFLKDRQRYLDTYFSKWSEIYPKIWNHGDWAYVDHDGYWFLRGRADDVIKVSGHRTGPAEIESALMAHPSVAECAAIGVPHAIKGESIVCFVVLKSGFVASDTLQKELKVKVGEKLGKTLTPDDIHFVLALPKTRSAKIVRGAIRKKFLGLPLGDISSVENIEALDAIGLKGI